MLNAKRSYYHFFSVLYLILFGSTVIVAASGAIISAELDKRFESAPLDDVTFNPKYKWNDSSPMESRYLISDCKSTNNSRWLVSLVVLQSPETSRFVRNNVSWTLVAVNKESGQGKYLTFTGPMKEHSKVLSIAVISEDTIFFLFDDAGKNDSQALQVLEWDISNDQVSSAQQSINLRDVDSRYFNVFLTLVALRGLAETEEVASLFLNRPFLNGNMATSSSWPDPLGKLSTWCFAGAANEIFILDNSAKVLSSTALHDLNVTWAKKVSTIKGLPVNESDLVAPMWIPRSDSFGNKILPLFVRSMDCIQMVNLDIDGNFVNSFNYEFDYPAFQPVVSEDGTSVTGTFYSGRDLKREFVDIQIKSGDIHFIKAEVTHIFSSDEDSIYCACSNLIFRVGRRDRNAISVIRKL